MKSVLPLILSSILLCSLVLWVCALLSIPTSSAVPFSKACSRVWYSCPPLLSSMREIPAIAKPTAKMTTVHTTYMHKRKDERIGFFFSFMYKWITFMKELRDVKNTFYFWFFGLKQDMQYNTNIARVCGSWQYVKVTVGKTVYASDKPTLNICLDSWCGLNVQNYFYRYKHCSSCCQS